MVTNICICLVICLLTCLIDALFLWGQIYQTFSLMAFGIWIGVVSSLEVHKSLQKIQSVNFSWFLLVVLQFHIFFRNHVNILFAWVRALTTQLFQHHAAYCTTTFIYCISVYSLFLILDSVFFSIDHSRYLPVQFYFNYYTFLICLRYLVGLVPPFVFLMNFLAIRISFCIVPKLLV